MTAHQRKPVESSWTHQTAMPVTPAPRVTVVVATRNRRRSLLRTLERVATVSGRPPVIVVDNGSTDGSPDAVRHAFPDVKMIRACRNFGAPARTLGAAAASTPYVAFSDDDSWWGAGSLDRAADAMDAHTRLGLVAARIHVGPHEVLDPVSAEMANSPLPADDGLPGRPVLGFLACGAVVRKTAYLEVGGFSEFLFFIGEERLLAMDMAQAGWGLSYLDEVVAHHDPHPRGDDHQRRRRATRNDLLSIWMRRRPRSALRASARILASASQDTAVRRGVGDALAALPEAVRRRQVVDVHLDRRLGMLE